MQYVQVHFERNIRQNWFK